MPQLTPKWTQGQKTSSNYRQSYQHTIVWRIKLPCVHQHHNVHLHQICTM